MCPTIAPSTPRLGMLLWGCDVLGGSQGSVLGAWAVGQWLLPTGHADPQPERGRPGAAHGLLQPALLPGCSLCGPCWEPRAALPLVGVGRAGALGCSHPPGRQWPPRRLSPAPFLRVQARGCGDSTHLPNPAGMTRLQGSQPSSSPWPLRRAVCSSTSGPSTHRSGPARTAPASRAPAVLWRPFRGLLVRAAQTLAHCRRRGACVCMSLASGSWCVAEPLLWVRAVGCRGAV